MGFGKARRRGLLAAMSLGMGSFDMGTLGIASLGAGAAAAQPAPVPMAKPNATAPAPVDYADPARWMCRPGADDAVCTADLDAMAIDAKGARTPVAFQVAAAPKLDCFYVYPTASGDQTMFSDLVPDAGEKRAIHAQAARLGSVCRLFVPLYHQFTSAALHYEMQTAKTADQLSDDVISIPYRDVLAAWRAYLARDNHGRGVILIGHSQGAMLLKRLIAEEIDGKPVQKRVAGYYLAGNPDLTTDSFRNIKPCARVGQTGCLVAWSTYRDTDTSKRVFGAAAAGKTAICVNPAAPGGGRGALKGYLTRPALAAASDPPWIEVVGQMSAECVSDAGGAVLRLRIEPSEYGQLLRLALDRLASASPGWGLHPLDIGLVQGNLLDLIAAQSAAWNDRR